MTDQIQRKAAQPKLPRRVHYVVHRADGSVCCVGECHDDMVALQAGPGETAIVVDQSYDPNAIAIVNGAVTAKTVTPKTLADAKQDAHARLRREFKVRALTNSDADMIALVKIARGDKSQHPAERRVAQQKKLADAIDAATSLAAINTAMTGLTND